MYKIDFKGKVQDVAEEEFEIAPALAIVLQRATTGDPMKFNAWATQVIVNEELTMDKADVNTLKDFIIGTSTLINLLKATILERLENKEEVKK